MLTLCQPLMRRLKETEKKGSENLLHCPVFARRLKRVSLKFERKKIAERELRSISSIRNLIKDFAFIFVLFYECFVKASSKCVEFKKKWGKKRGKLFEKVK